MSFFKVCAESGALKRLIFSSGGLSFKCASYISKYYNESKGAVGVVKLLKNEDIEEREDARTAGH
jgi:hypothetical protein